MRSRHLKTSRFAMLLLGLLATSMLSAQDALVRTSLNQQDSHFVGQRMDLVVELLAPGYFASAISFDLPDPVGVLLMPPTGSPLVGTETIDGVRYTTQRHHLSAWAMRAGDQSIPAFSARFQYKRNPLDTVELAAEVTTETMPFRVDMPPGAERLGTVISARDLQFGEQWDPQPGTENVEAGAAFTRIISFSAPNVPGMLFPPFNPEQVDGLGIYSKSQLQDETNRGTLTGKRTDTVTYVLQRPGQFTIPAAQFTWFDLDSGQLHTDTLPAVTFNVVANPNMASAAAGGQTDSTAFDWRWLIVIAAILLLVGIVVLFRQRLARWLNRLVAPLRPQHLVPLNPSAPSASQLLAVREPAPSSPRSSRTATTTPTR